MPVVTDILEDRTGSIFRELLDCMTLKVEALCPSYMMVTVNQWMWHDIPDNLSLVLFLSSDGKWWGGEELCSRFAIWICHSISGPCLDISRKIFYLESLHQILSTPSILLFNCSIFYLMSVALQYYESNEPLESHDFRFPLQCKEIFRLLGC